MPGHVFDVCFTVVCSDSSVMGGLFPSRVKLISNSLSETFLIASSFTESSELLTSETSLGTFPCAGFSIRGSR